MSNITGAEIASKSFWRKRLEDAKKDGHIQYSVYLANDDLWNRICHNHKQIFQNHILPTDKVLDAGCAYGRLSELFDNYLGVDFAPAFIEEAEIRYPNKRFMLADLKKLPLKDLEYDVGIVVSIKHMIIGNLGNNEWDVMQKELARVCKKLIILEYGDSESKDDTNESIQKYEIIS